VGQVLHSSKVEAGQLISLQKGIYVVRLQSTKGIFVQKIML
jgi:hypothetical protein